MSLEVEKRWGVGSGEGEGSGRRRVLMEGQWVHLSGSEMRARVYNFLSYTMKSQAMATLSGVGSAKTYRGPPSKIA